MRYSSLRRQAFLAAGAALIALSSASALHAQASVSYQTGAQGNSASSSTQVVRSGGQPGLPQRTVNIGPASPGGPAQFIGPPVVRVGGPGFGQRTWGAPGYGPNGYGQGGYGPSGSISQVYARSSNGSVYQVAPSGNQRVIGQYPRREQIVIPDATVTPATLGGLQPGGPMVPAWQDTPASRLGQTQIPTRGGGMVNLPVRTVSVYSPPAQVSMGGGRDDSRQHAPDFLGGFYFGNYCDNFSGDGSYPSAYSLYPGVPGFIYEPTQAVVVFSPPVSSPYVGGYIPFDPSDIANYGIENLYRYQELATTENPFLYHGPVVLPNPYAQPVPPPAQQPQQAPEQPANQEQPAQLPEPAAPHYQAGSYKEAFADIESAWINGDVDSIRKHLRDKDLKIAVSLNGKYSYSIASGDWADITRDALDHLQTVSFQFTVLRFQKNGDITGYANQVYVAATRDGDKQDTMYLSYTLRHRNNAWFIVDVDTSADPLIKEQKDHPAASNDQLSPAKSDKDQGDSEDSGS